MHPHGDSKSASTHFSEYDIAKTASETVEIIVMQEEINIEVYRSGPATRALYALGNVAVYHHTQRFHVRCSPWTAPTTIPGVGKGLKPLDFAAHRRSIIMCS